MTEATRKYRREQPETRREGLVEATLRCLAAHGHEGVSVRRIAAEAGVSVGLINHHYSSLDQLIAHAYEKVASGIVRQLLDVLAEAPPSPRDRLTAFFPGLLLAAAARSAAARRLGGVLEHDQAFAGHAGNPAPHLR